jgi:hypothetical protein
MLLVHPSIVPFPRVRGNRNLQIPLCRSSNDEREVSDLVARWNKKESNITSDQQRSGHRWLATFLRGCEPAFLINAYPNAVEARPAACTMSIRLCFGSANNTQSTAGISTPSVRHRALVMRAHL